MKKQESNNLKIRETLKKFYFNMNHLTEPQTPIQVLDLYVGKINKLFAGKAKK